MKLKIIFILILVAILPFTGKSLYAQNTVDSLEVEIKKTVNKNDTNYVKLLLRTSYNYWSRNPKRGVELADEAKVIASKIGYGKGLASSYDRKGLNYWSGGDYSKSLKSYIICLGILDSIDYQSGKLTVYRHMALTCDDQGNYDDALKYYSKVRDLLIELGYDISSSTLNNIGAVYHKMENYDSAYHYYNTALEIRLKNEDKHGIAETSNNIGVLFKDQGKYDQAKDYYNTSIKFKKEIESNYGLASSYNSMGEVYMLEGKFDEAHLYFDSSLVTAELSNSKKWTMETYSSLKELHKKTNNLEKALYYTNAYYAIKDSMYNAERDEQFARLEKEYDTLSKDKEIALLEKDNKIRLIWRNVFGGTLAGVLLFGLVFFFLQRQKMRKEKLLNTTKQELAEKEIENLQLQEKKLQDELDFKNKELFSYTLNFIQKRELFDNMQEYLKDIKKGGDDETSNTINKINRLVKTNNNIDKDWEQFNHHFLNVHPKFFQKLKEKHTNLSNADLRLSALLKMNLNVKESSAILGIGPDSVKTARHRLRKKLNLTRDDNLIDYILSIDVIKA